MNEIRRTCEEKIKENFDPEIPAHRKICDLDEVKRDIQPKIEEINAYL